MGVCISVIVPVYNDPEGIGTTLRALTKQSFPRRSYEIVVCDNNSTDATQTVVQRFQHDYPDLVRLVVEDQHQSSYAARNRGIANSTGDILAFVDADMWMDDDWLTRVVDKMQDDSIHYLGCNVEIVPKGKSLVGRYNALFGFRVRNYLEHEHFAPTCCLVIRRTVLERVGMFDSSLSSGGDRLFGNRVYTAGIEQHFAEHITLYHPARETLQSLTQKSLRVGRGNYQLAQLDQPESQEVRLSLRSFLPVKPHAYSSAVSARVPSHIAWWSAHLIFYVLACYTKWVRTAGYLFAAVSAALARTPA